MQTSVAAEGLAVLPAPTNTTKHTDMKDHQLLDAVLMLYKKLHDNE